MKIKNVIQHLILTLLISLNSLVLSQYARPQPVSAACADNEIEISVSVEQGGSKCIPKGTGENNPIFVYLRAIIRFVAAGVGMVLVLLIIIAGIRWMTSAGNPQGIASAQKMLFAAVVGLLAFVFTVALLNYIIPGNLISL